MVENRVEGGISVKRLLQYLICRGRGRGGIEPTRLSLSHNARRQHTYLQQIAVPFDTLPGACCSANVVCLWIYMPPYRGGWKPQTQPHQGADSMHTARLSILGPAQPSFAFLPPLRIAVVYQIRGRFRLEA